MAESSSSSSSTSRECKRASTATLETPTSTSAKRRKLLEEGEDDSSRLPENDLRSGTALFRGLTMIKIATPTESVSGDLRSSSCSDLASSRFKISSSGMLSMEERLEEDPETEIDIEQEEVWSSTETETTSTCITANFRFSTENNIPHLNNHDSESSEFKTKEPSSNRRMARVTKMPSQIEMEEFFWAAEKYEAERFTEKYNYDFVKDEPLEGRYRWSPLN